MIKFPIEYGVREVRGDQAVTRECYIAMLEIKDHLQTMTIEEQRTVIEPVKGQEEILLDNSRPEQSTRISTLSSHRIHQALTAFFVRTYVFHMLGSYVTILCNWLIF